MNASMLRLREHGMISRQFAVGSPTCSRIGLTANEVINALHALNVDLAESQSLRLAWLVRDLDVVRRYEWRYYGKIRRALRKAEDLVSFHGYRHELATCSILVRRGARIIDFERPDFTLHDGSKVECASARVEANPRGLTEQEVVAKLRAVIGAKAKKTYSDWDAVLVLDVSDIMLEAARLGGPLQRSVLEAACSSHETFGGVICLYTHYVPLAGELRRDFFRFDHPAASAKCREFLDRFYPISPRVLGNVTYVDEL